jgi:hypothetical protein
MAHSMGFTAFVPNANCFSRVNWRGVLATWPVDLDGVIRSSTIPTPVRVACDAPSGVLVSIDDRDLVESGSRWLRCLAVVRS